MPQPRWFVTQAESLWQMRCIARQPDYRPQVACGSTALLCCCCLCWKPTRRSESGEFGNSEQSVSRFSAFGWRSGFSLSQRQATSKVSIDIFVRFPLASSAGRSVHTSGPHKTPAATLRSQKSGLPTRNSTGMVRVDRRFAPSTRAHSLEARTHR